MSPPCNHTNQDTWWENDARGIPLAKVCSECVDEKLAEFRPDVLTDADYWADEDIEDELY